MEEKLKINDTITSIVGKNESGKTNLLNLLGNISFTNGMNVKEFKRKNRKLENKDTVSFEFKFKFDEAEKNK